MRKIGFLKFFGIFLSLNCNASEFNFKDYMRSDKSPVCYRLALLDKTMIINRIPEDDSIPEEVKPFILESLKTSNNASLEVKSFPEENGSPKHFIIQLKRRRAILGSAFLTNELLKENKQTSEDKMEEAESVESASSSEVSIDEDSEISIDDKDKTTTLLNEDEIDEMEEFDPTSSESCTEDDKKELATSLYKEETDEEIENDTQSESESEELEYASSMILFPVSEEPNIMLAYLLGNWSALLNTTSIVPFFGLKVVTSYGVASISEDDNLSNIKEISMETHRRAKPMRGVGKQQKNLGKMGDFHIDPASDGLEKVRLKPVESWGKALLDGDDFFKFRLPTRSKQSKKLFTQRHAMYEVAKEVYKIYSRNTIRKDFKPYLDEPVVNKDTIASLNTLLQKNWVQYKRENLLYTHWTFWFRLRGETNAPIILRNMEKRGFQGEINIHDQKYQTTQFIRSLPIPFCSNCGGVNDYYWFDRGRWYQIHAARFEAIKKRVNDITLPQQELYLPNYKVCADSKDYKELAYNKAAVRSMRAQIESSKLVSEAILLDREIVPLGTMSDKFEFADILMQSSDKKYFLIHLKREHAGQFDHHRTQAERCALFLGENLDRGALPGLLITGILQDFYREHITLPKEKKPNSKGEIKETEQPWSSNFKQKFYDERGKIITVTKSGKKRKRKENFFERVRDNILNVNKKERLRIKKIVTSHEFEPLISDFEPYEDALCRCFDALEDYYLYPSKSHPDSAPDHAKFIKGFLERVLDFLKKHSSFTKKHQGTLPYKDRNNITIVLGIIGDDSGKEDFHNQQLWGIDETRKIVEKQGFSFRVVFIKDETDKTIAKDKDSPKPSDDDKETVNDEDDESYMPSIKTIDLQVLKSAKEKAIDLYGKEAGYKDVSDITYSDENGQQYMRIKLDGSEGDCCFHALGIARKELIEKMKTYIEDHEQELLEKSQQIDKSISLRNICNPISTTAKHKDISALKGHSLLSWKDTIINATDDNEEKKNLDTAFNALIEQQGVDSVEWDKVLINSEYIKNFVDKMTSGDNQLIHYKEFLEKCSADLWKKVGNDDITSKIESHLIKMGVYDPHTKHVLKPISDEALDFSKLKSENENKLETLRKKKPRKEEDKLKKKEDISLLNKEISRLSLLEGNVSGQKLKGYVVDSIRFLAASTHEKKDILHNFYITHHEWLDPCAIMHLGSYFGFKVKLFRSNNLFLPQIRLDAQTPDADSPDGFAYRLMLYVDNNHYDLLFPINAMELD